MTKPMPFDIDAVPRAGLPENLREDYEHAVLHLAWDRAGDDRTLLFGHVELLPAEIPPPVDDYDPKSPGSSVRLGGKSAHYVYVRHAVMPAADAVAWYLACRGGMAVLPDATARIRGARGESVKTLRLSLLSEEPPWPRLVVSRGSDIPFCPAWIHGPRVHHLLPASDFEPGALWSPRERNQAAEWLESRLHFSLETYPEYWGSLHLVAPNPVYRSIDQRLRRPSPPAESVLLRVRPRAGKRIDGLEILFWEQEPWGTKTVRRIRPRAPVVRVDFPEEVTMTMLQVLDRERGALEVGMEAHAYLRSIMTKVALSHSVVVEAPGGSYEVTRSSGHDVDVVSGSVQPLTAARTRMLRAHYTRKELAEVRCQFWFRGRRDEAMDVLRALLHGAQKNVRVVDPYFGPDDLHDFVLAVARSDIPIDVLSSAEFLKERRAEQDGSGKEEGAVLLGRLRGLIPQNYSNAITVRVMGGYPPPIHDRFFLVDQRVWLLGSSLNSFGNSGTMLVELPDPGPVRDAIEEVWTQSEALDAWAQRRQSQSTGGHHAG